MTSQSLLEYNRHLPPLTLQEMNRIRIITSLCNHQELKYLILKCPFYDTYMVSILRSRSKEEWKAVEAMAYELVSEICKCVLLRKRILELLWPMSYRIMVWKFIYAPYISISFLQHFYWTGRGRINNIKTVRFLIGNERIPVTIRFALACSVCLKEEITEIWQEMTIEDKAYLYANREDRIYPLIRFWLHTLEGSSYDRTPYLDNALICASKIGWLEAVKYLFAITPGDKKIFMINACTNEAMKKFRSGHLLGEDKNDIECFFLSQMTDADREWFFNYYTETALSVLLHSSKYDLCLNFLAERLESASVEQIVTALEIIFYTYHIEIVDDEDCRLLFMEVWRKIPTRMKKTLPLKDLSVTLMAVLIADSFPFLLEKDAFQKIEKFTSSDFNFINWDKKVDFHQGKWNLLHFIIGEVITIPFLKKRKRQILLGLLKSKSNVVVFNRVLRFVRKVRGRNPNGNK